MKDINKLRQVKEYSDQGGTYTVPYKGADPVEAKKPKEFSEIYQEVANKVIDDIQEQLFELINEYSEDYDELYWNRFLTDDAPVELLDVAFENYHEHYDNIFKIIMSKLNK